MFADELADLKDSHPQRLHLVYVLSREPRASALLSGRIDGDRLRAILTSGLVDPSSVDEWFPVRTVRDGHRRSIGPG
jgi:ring-1,2-phenylacetyl-CoA epoxidase subunit PaaE